MTKGLCSGGKKMVGYKRKIERKKNEGTQTEFTWYTKKTWEQGLNIYVDKSHRNTKFQIITNGI